MDPIDPYHAYQKSAKQSYFWCCLLTAMVVFIILLRLLILEVTKSEWQGRGDDRDGRMQAGVSSILPDMAEVVRWGYGGKGVKVWMEKLHDVHKQEYQEGFREHSFNKYVSDRISMRRPLPDVRDKDCPRESSAFLPAASVVIVFRNEAWTTLLRTVYSIVDRSPPELLQEIILVDDGSTSDVLQYPRLEHYLSVVGKVIIVRLPSSVGTAKARNIGTERASGEVVIFMQPRCECTQGWLPPLLERISKNKAEIAMPTVDRIHYDNFEYRSETLENMSVGTFTWDMNTRRRHSTSRHFALFAVKSPVISEGIFAIDRSWFKHLHGFDEDLMLENSVNIEFSFRAWLCGGSVFVVPCSHVGYVFPKEGTELSNLTDDASIDDRTRIAETWLDGYKDFVYERFTSGQRENTKTQDSAAIKSKLREDLTCRDFGWYMRVIEPTKVLQGNIVSRGRINLIVTNVTVLMLSLEGSSVGLHEWYTSPVTVWYMTESGEIRTEDNDCLSLAQPSSPDQSPRQVVTQQSYPQNFIQSNTAQGELHQVLGQSDLKVQTFHDLWPESKWKKMQLSTSKDFPKLVVKLMSQSSQGGALKENVKESEPSLKQIPYDSYPKLPSLSYKGEEKNSQVERDMDMQENRQHLGSHKSTSTRSREGQILKPGQNALQSSIFDNKHELELQKEIVKRSILPNDIDLQPRPVHPKFPEGNGMKQLSQKTLYKTALQENVPGRQLLDEDEKYPFFLNYPTERHFLDLQQQRPKDGSELQDEIHNEQLEHVVQGEDESPEGKDKQEQNLAKASLHDLPQSQQISSENVNVHTQEDKPVLVLKPCGNNKGDQWDLTEQGMLRHISSGLCMVAQKISFENYMLRTVKCMEAPGDQIWTFSIPHRWR